MKAPPKDDFREQVENLVSNLFSASCPPFFDKSEIPFPVLDEFVQSDEVFIAASSFARALRAIWKEQHPGTDLRRTALSASSPGDVKPLVFTELSPETALPTPKHDSAPLDLSKRPGATPAGGAPQGRVVDRAASFQAPNAKAGHAYQGMIERVGAAAGSTQLREVRLPDELGLSFSESEHTLLGTPSVAGDHELTFQWSSDGLTWSPGKCILIVNPEPRSLWKINEPAAELPYRKAHLDGQLITAPRFKIAAASRRGRSHEHSGTFRDDDFFIHHGAASGWSVIIVADGAGSAKSSRRGSKLAVDAAGAHLVASLAGAPGAALSPLIKGWDADPAAAGRTVGEQFRQLFLETGNLAVQAIEAEALAQGASAKDYATTLLVAAVKKEGDATFLATFWMGDGAIAAYGPRAKVRLMGTPDGGEFAGQTRFLDRAALADSAFAKRIGIGCYTNLAAVVLMTDGVSDPRFETDNGLADAGKWDALWDEITPCLAAPDPDQQLLAWLEFFTPGHHDDRTIAVLWE
jgi:hypothetical protein